MTESTDRDLAADIEGIVREASGVTTIFHTGSLVSKLIDAGVQLIDSQGNGAPLITVERLADEMRVEVAIGVYADAGAVETSHRVHAAIAAFCAAEGCGVAEIHITVVHIDDASIEPTDDAHGS